MKQTELTISLNFTSGEYEARGFIAMDSLTESIMIYLLLLTGLLAHTIAAYSLITKKAKKVMDFLLINLNLLELVYIAQDLIVYSLIHRRVSTTKSVMTISQTLNFAIHQGIVLITTDRVMAVYLSVRYSALITKKRSLIALVVTWVMSLIPGISVWFCRSSILLQWTIWDLFMFIFLVCSYAYIIKAVTARKRKLNTNLSQSSNQQLKYRTPLLIVLFFTVLVLVPTLVVAVDVKYYTAWNDMAFKLNYTVDAFIYLLHSRRCCEKEKRWGKEYFALTSSSVKNASIAMKDSHIRNKQLEIITSI